MVLAFILSLIAVVLICFIVSKRIIRKKNIVLARLIDELERTRQSAAALLQENVELKALLKEVRSKAEALPVNQEESVAEDESQAQTEPEVSKEALDKFHALENIIIKEKLYLDPAFSQKEMLKRLGMNANKFSTCFKKMAGTSFTNYMQALRLEHATILMRKYPNWSLEAIAKDSCMSKSMFYDLFKKKFGISPAQYKKSGRS